MDEFLQKISTVDMKAANLKNVALLMESSDDAEEAVEEPVMWVTTLDGKNDRYVGENEILNKMRSMLVRMDTLPLTEEDAPCNCEQCRQEEEVGDEIPFDHLVDSITDNTELEFKDLRDEEFRMYDWRDGSEPIIIENPIALHVSASGGHRVLDAEGYSHYIPSGWKLLTWRVKPGCKPFAF